MSDRANVKPKATREAFGEALARLGQDHTEIVVLDGDLAKSTKSDLFAQRFPERFFEMGIEEANMIGAAAGLATTGKVPFACSFACFITGRFDQIRMSLAYAQANVRLVGSHAGVGVGDDGYSQQGLEDIAVMRALPGMTVLQPADDIETERMIEYLVMQHRGPAYLRTTRHKLERVHGEDYRFALGRVETLAEGRDVAILASGGTVMHALEAAHRLAGRLSVRVVNVPTLKPLDVAAIARHARETGRLLTVEDHQTIGGLGSAVCEAVAASCPVPVRRLGLEDCFGESGASEELYRRHRLDADGIVGTLLESR